MTTPRNLNELIRTYLQEDQAAGHPEVPDHVYSAIRDGIAHTRQRAVIGSVGVPDMNKFLVMGLGAAAVVVLAGYIGAQILGGPAPGGPAPTESPSSDGAVTGRPLPTVECADLEAGTYRTAIGTFSVTATVPTGWSGSGDRDSFQVVSRDCLFAGGVSLAASLVSHVSTSACDGQGTAVETGTPAAVIAALAAQTGHQTSGPTDTTMAGYPASRFEFSSPGAETCNGGPLWLDPGGDEGPGMYSYEDSGSFVTIYVIDVDGSALGIAVDSGVPDEPADVADLDAIVDSLRIEP